MADDVPTSRKVPPLVIIIVVVIAALAAIAFANMRGQTQPARGGPSAPQAAEKSVMPQTSTVPNAQQPASDERGAAGHHDNPNEAGGPATTANVVAAPR